MKAEGRIQKERTCRMLAKRAGSYSDQPYSDPPKIFKEPLSCVFSTEGTLILPPQYPTAILTCTNEGSHRELRAHYWLFSDYA